MVLMFNRPVVFVDIETTGGSYHSSRIIEIAAIRVEDGQVTDEFHTLVNPGSYLPQWISSLTGISEDDLVDAPYFEDISARLHQICHEAIFIAHNVRFDYSFIKNQLLACGYDFKPQLFCTVRLSRFLYPEHKGHKLQDVITRHNISVSERHRAYEDAYVLKQFTELAYAQKGAEAFEVAISKQLKSQTVPPNLPAGALDGITNSAGVYIFEDKEGLPLYIGKSINLRKRIMSHLTQDVAAEKEMKVSLSTHNITTIETENELQALLLESKLIKERLPLFNRQLRQVKKYTALIKASDAEGYTTIDVNDINLSEVTDTGSIYGLYASRQKAKSALLGHQKTFSLCPKLLGLEKGKGPCFKFQLGKCYGACSRREPADIYNLRVELALEKTKVATWPYKGPVIVKHKGDSSPALIIDQWRINAEYYEDGHIKAIIGDAASFSLDNYKILRGYLRTKSHELIIKPFITGEIYR